MAEEGNTNHSSVIGWGLICLLIAVILWLIWYFNADVISNTVRWIRYVEMWVISPFVDDTYTVMMNGKPVPWEAGFNYTPQYPPQQTPQLLSLFSALTQQPLRIPFTIILSFFGLYAYLKGPGTHYRKTLNIDTLIARQAKNFPIIAPFEKFNPSDLPTRPPGTPVPAELPLFAEALGPEEWLAYNNIPIPDGQLDRKKCESAFMKQLGGRWMGAAKLKPHEQILLAAFCLKAERKRDASDKLLGRIAQCWTIDKGLQFSKDRHLKRDAIKILRNRNLAAGTLEQANFHAFKTPALLRALQYAREEGGVLAPAQFVWLRAYDRNLWYPLNNLGRQSLHPEAMGAMAHFKAERMTKRPIPVPKVGDAVESMALYMASDKARPIPALDYSESKKRGIRKAIS